MDVDWDAARAGARRQLVCPACEGTDFDEEEGRIDSRFGFTSHKLVLRICTRCRLVLSFSAGNSIFDFD